MEFLTLNKWEQLLEQVISVHAQQLVFSFILIFITFIVLRPIVIWLVVRRDIVFLTYIIVSLFLIVFVLSLRMQNEETELILRFIEGISLFGFSLVIFYSFHYIKQKISYRLRRRPPNRI